MPPSIFDTDKSQFRSSRIYAQGWNAARKLTAGGVEAGVKLNPYPADPERARWIEGFTKALS